MNGRRDRGRGKPRDYTSANRSAAKAILAAVERNGGEGSLQVLWARAILQPKEQNQLELFQRAAS